MIVSINRCRNATDMIRETGSSLPLDSLALDDNHLDNIPNDTHSTFPSWLSISGVTTKFVSILLQSIDKPRSTKIVEGFETIPRRSSGTHPLKTRAKCVGLPVLISFGQFCAKVSEE